MRRPSWLLLAAAAASACVHAGASTGPRCDASYVRPRPPGTNVTLAEPQHRPGYQQRHFRRVQKSRERSFDFVFIGDSLTDMWTDVPDKGGSAVWNRHFAPRGGGTVTGVFEDAGAALYGYGGDTTGNLLWRIDNGEFDALAASDKARPTRVIVLNIGTNNLRDTPANIALGVEAVVHSLRCRVPTATILLMGLLPRQSGPWLEKVAAVNRLLRRLEDGGRTVRFVDIGSRFLAAPDRIRPELYRDDSIHLGPSGYAVWAEALGPVMREMGAF